MDVLIGAGKWPIDIGEVSHGTGTTQRNHTQCLLGLDYCGMAAAYCPITAWVPDAYVAFASDICPFARRFITENLEVGAWFDSIEQRTCATYTDPGSNEIAFNSVASCFMALDPTSHACSP